MRTVHGNAPAESASPGARVFVVAVPRSGGHSDDDPLDELDPLVTEQTSGDHPLVLFAP
jgi:hypothetical protein